MRYYVWMKPKIRNYGPVVMNSKFDLIEFKLNQVECSKNFPECVVSYIAHAIFGEKRYTFDNIYRKSYFNHLAGERESRPPAATPPDRPRPLFFL